MKNLWNSEPTAIIAAVQAAITLAVSFGFHLTADQIAAIITFSGLLLALFTRSQVHSQASVDAIKQNLTNPPAKFPDVH